LLPYLHLGPITIGTFGLFMWLAFVAAFFLWRKDLERRNIRADVHMMVAWIAIAGVVGAKLYHVLERPADLMADPSGEVFSRTGFAWFGGFIGGVIAMVLLARRYRVPILALMDSAAPAAALGYAIGRIGCITSGDGDYGRPTSLPWGLSFPPPALDPSGPYCLQYGLPETCKMHPTPIYELLVGIVICVLLWRIRKNRPAGFVTGWFFVLSGLARFLVEFIRLNPRIYWGMSNAQVASLASIVIGVLLLFHVTRTERAHPAPSSAF
jgi:phosphatidylglycerol:prolipoprotein diacylglycerol transferase